MTKVRTASKPALLALVAVVAGCGGAASSSPTQDEPIISASPSTLATPIATASPSPAPTPEPLPAVDPSIWPEGLSAWTITDNLRVRSHASAGAGESVIHGLLPMGARFRIAEGPVPGTGYWWYRIDDLSTTLEGGITEGWVASADTDGTPWIGPTPEACEDFPFARTAISVSSLTDLQAGVTGHWGGCLSTPWTDPYWVTITFRDDGTYSAKSLFKGPEQPAFYYGSDENSPQKRYAVLDLQDSGLGIGEIDIWFWEDNLNRGDLRNIRLMGDQLEFEFFHQGTYGPLTYRLYRMGSPG